MSCPEQDHKHLSNEDADKICKTLYNQHVKMVQTVQKEIAEKNICETIFLNILITTVCKAASEVIKHLIKTTKMERQQCIDMVLQGIAENVGAKYMTLDSSELIAKVRKNINVTTH